MMDDLIFACENCGFGEADHVWGGYQLCTSCFVYARDNGVLP